MNLIHQLILSLFISVVATAQTSPSEGSNNIIPNPSFEKYAGTPLGWFYKGKHFTSVMKYWNAPTGASPDVFGPKVRIPNHWAEKGFGQQKARTGQSMIGLTIYGCEEGKPHCREYIQIQLKEPLVLGQKYYFECWTQPLPRSLYSNNLGAYFSVKEVQELTDILIEATPQINQQAIIKAGGWTKVSGNFQADKEYNYLIIGNFHNDEATSIEQHSNTPLNYAYYYVDDILLKKEEPILAVPIKEDDLSKISLEEGRIITLKNIFFETDKYELLPRSFIELNKLLKLMKENSNMVIEIRGHTDIRGTERYNKYLSRKRAKAVILFLIENNIEPSRLHYKGYGSAEPIAKNNTTDGRQLNRRVEFKILSNKIN